MFNVRTFVPVVTLVLLLPLLAVPAAAVGPAVRLAVEVEDAEGARTPFGGSVPSDANILLFAAGIDAQGGPVAQPPAVFWSVEGGCGDIAPVAPAADGKSSSALFDPTTAGTSGCRVRISTQAAPVVPEETSGVDASNALVGWSGVVAVQAAGPVESVRVRTAAGGLGVEMGAGSFTTDGEVTLYAAGYDHDFNFLQDVAATWTLTNPTVAAVSAAGAGVTVDFRQAGSTTVTAAFSGASDATGLLTVGAGAISAIQIATGSACGAAEVVSFTTNADTNVALHALGYDTDGNCLGAATADWSVSGGAGVFTPSTAASSTAFNPKKAGAATVTAKLTATPTILATSAATITAGAFTKYAIACSTCSAGPPVFTTAGTSTDFVLTAQDADGNTVPSVAGAKSITFTGPATSPAGGVPTCAGGAIGTARSVTFTAGSATVACVLKQAVTGVVLTATEGTLTAATAEFDVRAGAKALVIPCVQGLGQSFSATTGLCTGPLTAAAPGNPGFLVDFYALDAERNVAAYTATVPSIFAGALAAHKGGNQPTARSGTQDVAFGQSTTLSFANGKATTMVKLYRAVRTNVTVDSVAAGELDVDLPEIFVNAGAPSDLGILDCAPTWGNRTCIRADPTGTHAWSTESGLTLYAAAFDVFGNIVTSNVAVDWVQSLPDGTPSSVSRGQNRQQFFFGSEGNWKIDISSSAFPGKTATLTVAAS